jgi:hypothetical protein
MATSGALKIKLTFEKAIRNVMNGNITTVVFSLRLLSWNRPAVFLPSDARWLCALEAGQSASNCQIFLPGM